MKKYIEYSAGLLLIFGAIAVEIFSTRSDALAPVPRPGQTETMKGGPVSASNPCWLVPAKGNTAQASVQRDKPVQLVGKIDGPSGTRVILDVDGEQVSVGQGETVKGVTLVEQNEGEVILEVAGRRIRVSLEAREGR